MPLLHCRVASVAVRCSMGVAYIFEGSDAMQELHSYLLMFSHRALCPKPQRPDGTTWVRHCHMQLISTRKSPYFANFLACFLPMTPLPGQLISVRRQVLAFLFLRQMSARLALIFLAVGMVVYHRTRMLSISTILLG